MKNSLLSPASVECVDLPVGHHFDVVDVDVDVDVQGQGDDPFDYAGDVIAVAPVIIAILIYVSCFYRFGFVTIRMERPLITFVLPAS